MYYVVGLYANIPHGECLASLYKLLETRESRQILSGTLAELAEIVFKNDIFEFDEKPFKQKHGTTIGILLLFMLFFLWLILRKKCLRKIFFEKNNDLVELYR